LKEEARKNAEDKEHKEKEAPHFEYLREVLVKFLEFPELRVCFLFLPFFLFSFLFSFFFFLFSFFFFFFSFFFSFFLKKNFFQKNNKQQLLAPPSESLGNAASPYPNRIREDQAKEFGPAPFLITY